MVDQHLSNPAGRLWLVYTEASNKAAEWTFGRTMREYLSLPADGPAWDYMPVALDLRQLTLDLETAVSNLVDPVIPVASLLKPVDKIRRVLDKDPLGNQRNDQTLIDIGGGETLTQLEYGSHLLNRVSPQVAIADDTITRIKKLAQEIVDLAMNDDGLDPAARELFIRYATRISEAAALYKVTGPQPLLDELDRYSSALHRVKPEASPTLRSRANALFGTVTMAIALFTGPIDVAHAIDEYPDFFTVQQVIEAPAPGDSASIIAAQLEPDEPAPSPDA